jgi:hypothetical protein
MATAKPIRSGPQRSRLRRLLLAGALLALAVLAAFWTGIRNGARLDAAMGARLACSCRYLGGRSLGDCRKDVTSARVVLSEDEATKTITARVPLLATDRASFHQGAGCRLDPWTD